VRNDRGTAARRAESRQSEIDRGAPDDASASFCRLWSFVEQGGARRVRGNAGRDPEMDGISLFSLAHDGVLGGRSAIGGRRKEPGAKCERWRIASNASELPLDGPALWEVRDDASTSVSDFSK
jgi:hypothetical protein